MGFRPEPTIYKLNFSDTVLAGLVVRAKCCTMAEYNGMLRATQEEAMDPALGPDGKQLRDAGGDLLWKPNFTEVADKNDEQIALFAKYLVDWNLEAEDGTPVPATLEGVNSQERVLISQIIAAWQVALVTVPPPLNLPSLNGETSLEQPPMTDVQSLNPGSWPSPNQS